MEGEEWLRGQAEGVCDGEADAAVANVQREDARGWMHVKISVRKMLEPVWGLGCYTFCD